MKNIDFTSVMLLKDFGDNQLNRKTPANTDTQTGSIHMLMKQTQPRLATKIPTLVQYDTFGCIGAFCLYKL